MREILFKAKKKNNGEWVEGYYVKSRYYEGGITHFGITHFIIDTENEYDDYDGFSLQYEIDPDTICQYTGLTDRNGTKIFENDIVTSDDFCPDNEGYGVIEWRDEELMFTVDTDDAYYDFVSLNWATIEVIGNIFDNPELLGGIEE